MINWESKKAHRSSWAMQNDLFDEFSKKSFAFFASFARDQIASQRTFLMTAISSNSARSKKLFALCGPCKMICEIDFPKKISASFASDQIASQRTFAMTAISSSSARDQNEDGSILYRKSFYHRPQNRLK